MDTKFRITAFDENGTEIGSWVFEGPRQKAIRKAMGDMLDHGVVPSRIDVDPVRDYSPSTSGRY
jgi:hypothetical protein